MGSNRVLPNLDRHFPRYEQFDPQVPVWCVTPETRGVTIRYYDTSPFSPSGRYMALLHFPYEDRLPEPGDVAEVILVDLETGAQETLADTRGWDTQTGAYVQWGRVDTELYYNDLDPQGWRAYGVKMNPFTGARQELGNVVYMVSPDGRWAATPCPYRHRITQEGYGVVVPLERVPRNRGASETDGVYLVDTETGTSRLLVSLRQIVAEARPAFDLEEYREGDFYAAHVKWNSTSDRLMLVARWVPWADRRETDKMFGKVNLITMRADGSEIHRAIPNAEWGVKGGHHPGWCPDGEHVMMNLNLHGDGMRFVTARYDGTGLRALTDKAYGSGHPTMHPNGRHILTDGLPSGQEPFGDGTTVIRLVDIVSGEERHLVRILNTPPFLGPNRQFRVDVHPAWDYGFQRIAFNACPDGTRRTYVADMRGVVGTSG